MLCGAAESGAGHPLWHLLLLVLAPVAIIVTLTRYDKFRVKHGGAGLLSVLRRNSDEVPLNLRLVLIGLASTCAALVHLGVCPPHLDEYLAFGLFFLGLCLGQLAWTAWLLLRPSRQVLMAGVAGNLAIVGIWVLTRTAGLPFGPAAGQPAGIGALDVGATVLEVAVVILALSLMRPRGISGRRSDLAPGAAG